MAAIQSSRGASKPRPQPVYDADFARRAREATQKATDNTRKGR